MIQYYRVSFFITEKEKEEKTGKMKKTGKSEYLGSVVVDDFGCDKFTITAKAFRQCSANCLHADKVIVDKV